MSSSAINHAINHATQVILDAELSPVSASLLLFNVCTMGFGTVLAAGGTAACSTLKGVPLGATAVVAGSSLAVAGATGALVVGGAIDIANAPRNIYKIVTGKSQSKRCNID